MLKTLFRSSAFTIALFVIAGILLLVGTVGAVQAAPRIVSNDWRAEVVLTDIETALTECSAPERGFIVREGDDDLLTTFLDDNEPDTHQIKIGKTYPYQLGVRNVAVNDGNSVDQENNGIDQYVRVTVNKYWVYTDNEGKLVKDVSLDPSLIKLDFYDKGENGWTIDWAASTEERTVLYYTGNDNGIIATGDDSEPFTKTLTIDSAVLDRVTKLNGQTSHDYANVQFRIEASVDAVQTHNAVDAMTSAWGRTNRTNEG